MHAKLYGLATILPLLAAASCDNWLSQRGDAASSAPAKAGQDGAPTAGTQAGGSGQEAGAVADSDNGGESAGEAGGSGAAGAEELAGSGTSAAVGGGSQAGAPAAGTAAAGAAAEPCPVSSDKSHPPERLALNGALAGHDPSLIEHEGQYYLFHTGPGLPIKQSKDLQAWSSKGRVFARNPSWIAQRVSGVTDLWAPDISFFGGQYHLYYAASTAGSNHSCIGHATSSDPTRNFTDQGSPVICSNPNNDDSDGWNAIDPNFVQDESGKPSLIFGSFWGGLKLIQLDDTGQRKGDSLVAIAARPNNGGAIEAPYVVRRCGYFYLFASFDLCCDGANSTYKIMVGRSTALAGPYSDREGKPVLEGGGTLLVKGDDVWHGPGHNAVIANGERWFDVHHAYYAGMTSRTYTRDGSYLRVSELVWDDQGWPVSAGP
jgi:arabinan endo-1,5-alpha-L-arabinosidase